MKAADVRRAFLEFFKSHGHEVVRVELARARERPDAAVHQRRHEPVQGRVHRRRDARRTSARRRSQKCVRAGGKHNDLDEVGKTPRHHTFFEMLGNFSFGDYFKEDAIAWAWELLTEVLRHRSERAWCVTVFGGDRRCRASAPTTRRARSGSASPASPTTAIIGLGKKDNFWQMGDTGPMGPCTEIHYFMDGEPARVADAAIPASVEGLARDLEPGVHAVRAQGRRTAPLDPLPAPSIDTGAGLERVTRVVQGVQLELRHRSVQPASSRRRRELARHDVRRRRRRPTRRCA